MCIEKEYNWRGAGMEEPRQRSEGGVFYPRPRGMLGNQPGVKETDTGINSRL